MSDMPTPDDPTPDPGSRPTAALVEAPGGPGSQSLDAPGPDTDTPPGMQAVAPPSRRSKFLRFGIIVGTLVIVWGIILPQFIDYQDIVDTLASLGPQQMLLMLVLASVAWLLQGAILSTTLPGLSLWRGFQSWMIMAALGSSIPAGPFNLAVVYVVYRGWGFAPGPSSATLLLFGLFDQLSRLLLPAFALVFLLLAGYEDPDFFLIAAVGVVIVVVAIGVVMGILRSEALAQRIGRVIERIATRVLGIFKRATPEGIPQAIVRFRDQFGDTLRASGPPAFAIAVLSKMAWAIVLIAALRIVGVPADELPASWIFAVFAAVFVITIIPIAPGGAGVPELLYISMLTQLAPGYETEISSGVFLYRIYQWFLPIPIGWVLLWVARRGRGGLLSTSIGSAPAPAAG